MTLDSVLGWLGPILVPMVLIGLASLVWAIVSGLFNTIYDRRSPKSDAEWAAAFAKHPRWAAIVSVMKTAGFNIPGWLRSLRSFFGGGLPQPIRDVLATSRPATKEELEDVARRAAQLATQQVRQLDPAGIATNVHVDVAHAPSSGPPVLVSAAVSDRSATSVETHVQQEEEEKKP